MTNTSPETTPRAPYHLKTLYFYLTEGCNLACRHCWLAPRYAPEAEKSGALDPALFRSIVEQARPLGLGGVKLTGGEPLLHPGIGELLAFVRDQELRFTVETNGVLCTPERAQQMAACAHPHVSVSLDGADAETHEWVRGVKGCFEAALQGIHNLTEAGVRPQIILTVMRRTRDQMEPIVRLAESLGAGSVKFNVLQPTARAESIFQAGEALTIGELVELGRWVEERLTPSTSLRVTFDHPPAFRPLSRMFGESGDGCAVCGIRGILGVLADGSYALCGIGSHLPEMVFGHAATDALEEVWRGHPVLVELRKGLPARLEGVCGDCILAARCLGSCIAQNYYRTHSLWSPFWFCHEAAKAGLFPDSRRRSGLTSAPPNGSPNA